VRFARIRCSEQDLGHPKTHCHLNGRIPFESFPGTLLSSHQTVSFFRRGGLKGGGKVIDDSEPFVDLWGDDVVGETSSSTTLSRGRELSEGPEVSMLLFASCLHGSMGSLLSESVMRAHGTYVEYEKNVIYGGKIWVARKTRRQNK
jgi:hypothetical protein